MHGAKFSLCSYKRDSALLSEHQHVFSVQRQVTQTEGVCLLLDGFPAQWPLAQSLAIEA